MHSLTRQYTFCATLSTIQYSNKYLVPGLHKLAQQGMTKSPKMTQKYECSVDQELAGHLCICTG